MQQGLSNGTASDVRLSVCLIFSLQQCALGLLLLAPSASNIDLLLNNASAAHVAALRSISTAAQRSAANVSSVMFSAP